MTFSSDQIEAFLDALELAEARLLSWGVADGAFSEGELQSRAETYSALEGHPGGGPALIRELERRALVGSFVSGDKRYFRTRSAEAVRLLAELRQLLPKHSGTKWRLAPTLVGDYRYVVRPRDTPKRSKPANEAAREIANEMRLSPAGSETLSRLLSAVPLWSPFQLRAIRRLIDQGYGRGGATVITAGTGSGKTYAFYVPALFHLAEELRTDTSTKTRILAIYPRRELLADQLLEALRQIDRISATTARPIRVGAFFAAVPTSAAAIAAGRGAGWESNAVGWTCPYLTCIWCGGPLAWLRTDVLNGRELLKCQRSTCGREIGGDRLALTRDALQRNPPEILFTTTESMNRRMTDGRYAHLFGTSGQSSVRMVLLDEVHIYDGIHGAQVGLLLRRWQRLSRSRAHFVGLSATLENATDFMSAITGVVSNRVHEVTPTADELVHAGAEYLVALRGDPASRTSLVSTTIQTAMLIARMQDVRDPALSDGLYGQKVFVFTDDLDVTNRLYHNIRSAEGWDLPPRALGSLANLRGTAMPDHPARLESGQAWDFAERIGHRLNQGSRLMVGRTTSQDEGVDRRADIVVATESLTVGFNDPYVGAVIQHKAPRHPAQFIQRRGRAGRNPRMRPWTIVVLSDYGRDRVAYQSYDLLFAPRVAPHGLPVRNRYVLRIQAVFAVLDWIFLLLGAEVKRSLWDLLTYGGGDAATGRVRDRVKRLLDGVLESGDERVALQRYLSEALGVDATEVEAICWEGPRPVLRGAIPLLLRRLEANESTQTNGDGPLPEFVPSSLFADLNLPNVAVSIQGLDDQSLPIAQAIDEFAPGRVSRRYAIRNVRHWIPVALDRNHQTVELAGAMTAEPIGTVIGRAGADVPLCRPRLLRPVPPGPGVLDASNARLEWRTEFRTFRPGRVIDVLPPIWLALGLRWTFHMHALGAPVEIKRFSETGTAELATRGGRRNATYDLAYDGEKVAVGYAGTHDAVQIRLRIGVERSCTPTDPDQLAGFRTLYFAHLVSVDTDLAATANSFERQWLGQIYLSTLSAYAVEAGTSLEEAQQNLLSGSDTDKFEEAIAAIFQRLSDEGEPSDADTSADLEARVQALLREADVLRSLSRAAQVLWSPLDEAANSWGRRRLVTTYALAFREAIVDTCSDVEAEDLTVDVESHDDDAEVWISETNVGGLGSIETLFSRLMSDPQRFFRLVLANLGPSDYEIIDIEIPRFLELVRSNQKLAAGVTTMRAASTQQALHDAFESLIPEMTKSGVFTCHPVIASLAHRVLRRGSSDKTDEALRTSLERWRDAERRLGVEIDARVIAFVLAKDESIQTLLAMGATESNQRLISAYGRISSMLWPRGAQLRAFGLAGHTRFGTLLPSDRIGALAILRSSQVTIPLAPDWRIRFENELNSSGDVVLRSAAAEAADLKNALLELAAEPCTVGFLFLYPRLTGVRRLGERLEARLELREGVAV